MQHACKMHAPSITSQTCTHSSGSCTHFAAIFAGLAYLLLSVQKHRHGVASTVCTDTTCRKILIVAAFVIPRDALADWGERPKSHNLNFRGSSRHCVAFRANRRSYSEQASLGCLVCCLQSSEMSDWDRVASSGQPIRAARMDDSHDEEQQLSTPLLAAEQAPVISKPEQPLAELNIRMQNEVRKAAAFGSVDAMWRLKRDNGAGGRCGRS